MKACTFCTVLILFATILTADESHAQSLTVQVTNTLPTLTIPANGSTSDTQSTTFTTSWSGFLYATGQTCVYMPSPLTGTTGNPDTITASMVQVTPTGGTTSYIDGSTACGITGSTKINTFTGLLFWAGNKSTQVQFQVVNASTLAADTYKGTIYVIATTN